MRKDTSIASWVRFMVEVSEEDGVYRVLAAGPADEGRGVLQGRVAPHARADEELADLAPEARRIGDDGAEIDVVGEPVE